MSQKVMSAEDLATLGKLFVEAKEKLLGVKLPELPSALTTRTVKPATRPQPVASASGMTTAHGLGIGSLKT